MPRLVTTSIFRMFRQGGLTALVLVMFCCPWPARAAGPLYWDMPAGRPFDACRLDGVKITADGFLAPGLALGKGCQLAADVVWSIIPDGKGGYYLGTGHHGRILWINPQGEPFTFAELECDEVMSLDLLPDGRLVAGCEPEGEVYLIDSQGQATSHGKTGGGYIWGITHDDQGRLYLATGSPAGLTVMDPDQGLMNELKTFPAQNAMGVRFTSAGDLLVATQGPGMVYRLDPAHPDQITVILQTLQSEVNALVSGPGGRLFALALDSGPQDQGGASGSPDTPDAKNLPGPVVMVPGDHGRHKGKAPLAALYDLESPVSPAVVWSGDLDLLAVNFVPGLGWVAGGIQGKDDPLTILYRLVPPVQQEILTSWQGGDIVALHPSDPAVLVVQANPSRVDVCGPSIKGSRTVTGPVLDAERVVDWGRLSWLGDPTSGHVQWSVRTGNRSLVDESWTDWTGSWSDGDHRLDVPASRFLQWRAAFGDDSHPDLVRVTGVTVSAWGENRPPVITAFQQEQLQGVRAGGLMAQHPNLTRSFASGLKAEFTRKETPQRPQPAERVQLGNTVAVFSWSVNDPDQDRWRYELACRKRGDEKWQDIAKGENTGLDAWDTATVPDGVYDLRLTVTDSPDNPAGRGLSSDRELGPVVVDNTPPDIQDLKASLKTRELKVEFRAADAGSPLAAAFLVMPDDTRERLDPVDLICDSPRESFACRHPVTEDEAAPAWVQVEVLDAAGNLAVGKCRIKGD